MWDSESGRTRRRSSDMSKFAFVSNREIVAEAESTKRLTANPLKALLRSILRLTPGLAVMISILSADPSAFAQKPRVITSDVDTVGVTFAGFVTVTGADPVALL